MQFHFFGRIYRSPEDEIGLHDVWAVAEGELGGIGKNTLKNLEQNEDLAALHRAVAWQSQAVIEFADLMGQPIPHKGRWQHISYLYFEALSSLRESVISGLNGFTRASLSVLRAAFEMFLLHCWWQERLFLKESYEPFYEWLSGEKPRPPFKNFIQDNFKAFALPRSEINFAMVMEFYKQICSYVHAPVLHESVTTINGGNSRTATKEVSLLWLAMTHRALRIVLEQLVFHKPQCLFPVDLNKKFAFSPPVGMYFDHHNAVALQAALGKELYEKYRQSAKGAQIIQDVMSFYENQEDLTDEQILDTWGDVNVKDFGADVPPDIETRWMLVKARMRTLAMSLSYGDMETAFTMGKGIDLGKFK